MNGMGIPGNEWGSKCQTAVHVSLMGVVQVGLAHTITLGHGTAPPVGH